MIRPPPKSTLFPSPTLFRSIFLFGIIPPIAELPGPEVLVLVRLVVLNADGLLATPQALQAFIDGDPQQPRGKAGRPLKIRQVEVSLQEGALGGVLGIFPHPGNSHQGAVDPLLVAFYQLRKRLGVSSLDPRHNGSVGILTLLD